MSRKSSDDEPFSGLAFKIMTDPFVGSLTFVRVYSGVLEVRKQLLCVEDLLLGLQNAVLTDGCSGEDRRGCATQGQPQPAFPPVPHGLLMLQTGSTLRQSLKPAPCLSPLDCPQAGSYALNAAKGKKERIGRLMQVRAAPAAAAVPCCRCCAASCCQVLRCCVVCSFPQWRVFSQHRWSCLPALAHHLALLPLRCSADARQQP